MLFRLRMAGSPVLARVRHQVPAPACGGPSGVASGGQTHLRWVSRYAGRRCSRIGRSSCLSRPPRPAAPASPSVWIDQPWARPAPARLRKSSAGQPPCPASCTGQPGRVDRPALGETRTSPAPKIQRWPATLPGQLHRQRRCAKRPGSWAIPKTTARAGIKRPALRRVFRGRGAPGQAGASALSRSQVAALATASAAVAVGSVPNNRSTPRRTVAIQSPFF